MSMNLRAVLAVLIVAIGLTGCGYQLRGSTGGTWNLGRVYMKGGSATGAEVQRLLVLNGVEFVSRAGDADTILTITRDTQERQVLSVDPDTGKVREYELIVETSVLVVNAGGKVLLEDDDISLQRDYTFDETAALGKYEQEGTLYREIRKDLAAAIVRRLQALHPATAAAE
jgi:LPS-assembly lipoprotein